MGGVSSKAANALSGRKKFNGNELQQNEFSDGSGLEFYDFNARTYDQQIGRFIQIDPETEFLQESFSPFHFGINNPILYDDPDGKNPIGLTYKIIRALSKVVEWSTSQSTVAPAAMTSGFLRDGTTVVKTVMDLKTLKEVKSVNAQAENKEQTARGSNNQKTRESAKTGQEAHRQEQSKLKHEGAETEVTMQLKDGTVVRKDAVRPDGTTVIIKPDTKTGRASADKRAELMEKNGHKTEKILYDSKDPKYQPGSPSYIGPKKTS
jgi:RHS repeat-associated protein